MAADGLDLWQKVGVIHTAEAHECNGLKSVN
jgi:hypothetical protein